MYTKHSAKYIFSFKKISVPNFACGDIGTSKHCLTSCPLTQSIHLSQITLINEQFLYKLANNKHVKNRGKAVIGWLNDNKDDVT